MTHLDKTPVTLLQELLVKKQILPVYKLIGGNGAGTHEPLFHFEVSAPGIRQSAIGSGKSKKEAKHEAARLLLEKLCNETNDEEEELLEVNKVNSPYAEVLKDNAVGMLHDFCVDKKLRLPDYDLIADEGLPHAKRFSYKCSVSSFTTEAQARTKKQAKQLAAHDMYNLLKDCLQDVVLPSTNTEHDLQNKEIPWSENCPIKMCKDILEELDFPYKSETLPTNGNLVSVCLTVEGNPTWAFYGIGKDTDQAVRNAFIEALTFLVDMVK